MKIDRKRRSAADVFTGTLADVSFLLVIFFMVTAAFSIGFGIDFSVGEPPTAEDEIEPWEAVDIHVQEDGSLKVDGDAMVLDELLPYVWTKLEKNPGKPVILRCEPSTSYGDLISVLDELRQSHEKLGFVITNLALPTFREQLRYSSPFLT
jgi:biopolymer transport protein ExbD